MVANLNASVIFPDIAVIHGGLLTIENVGTVVNYHGIFIPLAPYHLLPINQEILKGEVTLYH